MQNYTNIKIGNKFKYLLQKAIYELTAPACWSFSFYNARCNLRIRDTSIEQEKNNPGGIYAKIPIPIFYADWHNHDELG